MPVLHEAVVVGGGRRWSVVGVVRVLSRCPDDWRPIVIRDPLRLGRGGGPVVAPSPRTVLETRRHAILVRRPGEVLVLGGGRRVEGVGRMRYRRGRWRGLSMLVLVQVLLVVPEPEVRLTDILPVYNYCKVLFSIILCHTFLYRVTMVVSSYNWLTLKYQLCFPTALQFRPKFHLPKQNRAVS